MPGYASPLVNTSESVPEKLDRQAKQIARMGESSERRIGEAVEEKQQDNGSIKAAL
jgi:hypothetical protein